MVKSLLFDLEKGTKPVLDMFRSESMRNTVEYIRVEYWGDGNVLVSEEELVTIFGIIGSLPRIRELRIEFDELPLPAQALRNVLACPGSCLRYLALEDVRLSGSVADFDDVAEAIRKTSSLRTFRMYRCGPAHDTRATLDPIIAALSTVPTLNDVTLSSTHVSEQALGKLGQSQSLDFVSLDHMTVSGIHLGELCKSRSIQELKLWGMPEINDDITFMTKAVANNNNNQSNLKMLRIRYCNLNEQSGIQLARMIGHNKSLESLTLENLNWINFGKPLQQALETNNSMRTLSLSFDSKDMITTIKEDAIQIVAGLEQNQSLRKLRILFRHVDARAVNDAFLAPVTKLLQKNYTLESLYLNSSILCLSNEIDFLLKLNKTRKRHLLRDDQATKASYVDMLAAHSDDLSITHYVMVMNPALFRS